MLTSSAIKPKNVKGFTLIELLIVVAVMGVLSGVTFGVININGLRAKTRDGQRVADIKKIQTALELYFTDNRTYPGAASAAASSWVSASSALSALVPNYISTMPTDPTFSGASMSCNGTSMTDTNYLYRTDNTGSRYMLVAKTEVPTSASASYCSAQSNCSAFSCSACSFSCYGVQNPL